MAELGTGAVALVHGDVGRGHLKQEEVSQLFRSYRGQLLKSIKIEC